MIRYAKQILGEAGKVYASNSTDKVSSFCFADDSAVTPLIYSDEYIPFIKDYCIKNSINMVIPLFDIDAEKLAKHKEEFAHSNIIIVVSDYDKVRICNDKWLTYKFLVENDVLCPKTFLNQDELLTAINAGEIIYPVIIKPRWGMGSIGICVVRDEEQLIAETKRVREEVAESYIKYFDEMDSGNSLIYQEYVAGQEYGLDVMNNLCRDYLMTVSKIKLQMRAGETDSAIVVADNNMSILGEKLSNMMKNIGNLDVDVIRKDSKDYVVEMNARFGGGYPFSHTAGANLLGYILTGDEEYVPCIDRMMYNVEMYKDMSIIGCNNA